MSDQRKFGIWMDNHHATVVGKENPEANDYSVIAHVKNEGTPDNSSEKNLHNHENALRVKFFKEIASHMLNPQIVHVTGTGQAQEQFIHWLAETPQYKNVKATECTSNKMSDEKLVEFLGAKLN